jgi:hypothetical protein
LLHNASPASSTFVADPEIFAKSTPAIESLKGAAYLILKLGEEVSGSIFERLLGAHFQLSFRQLLSVRIFSLYVGVS